MEKQTDKQKQKQQQKRHDMEAWESKTREKSTCQRTSLPYFLDGGLQKGLVHADVLSLQRDPEHVHGALLPKQGGILGLAHGSHAGQQRVLEARKVGGAPTYDYVACKRCTCSCEQAEER